MVVQIDNFYFAGGAHMKLRFYHRYFSQLGGGMVVDLGSCEV